MKKLDASMGGTRKCKNVWLQLGFTKKDKTIIILKRRFKVFNTVIVHKKITLF